MTIFKYENEKITQLDNSKLNLAQIGVLLNSIVKNSDEFVRLYMDEERIESLKKKETAFEFILSEEINVITNNLGELKFRRILIPFTGEFTGDEKNSNTTFFIGNDKYFPEPISSLQGYNYLIKLKSELDKNEQ